MALPVHDTDFCNVRIVSRRHRDERTSRIEALDRHPARGHRSPVGLPPPRSRRGATCPELSASPTISPTTDSSLRPPVPPPVAYRPNPTTPSSPSARGRSRCAPRASARSRSRSRWRGQGRRSGRRWCRAKMSVVDEGLLQADEALILHIDGVAVGALIGRLGSACQ